MLNLEHIKRACTGKPNLENLRQAYDAYKNFGKTIGLHLPHRDVQYFAQIMHESGDFRYDKEVWGPTPAQKRYEGRKDLGNTVKGDGSKFRGRGPIQITGRANYKKFSDWCRKHFAAENPPDFTKYPEKINEDPWEGLVGLWYWDNGNPDGRSLNRYADEGNNEMITKRINGGFNGLEDRLVKYRRLGLVVLGYGVNDVRLLQNEAVTHGYYLKRDVDGDDGPKTRSAIHRMLMDQSGSTGKAAPVSEKVEVTKTEVVEVSVDKPVIPPSIEKEVNQKTNWGATIFGGGGLLAGAGTWFAGMDKDVLILIAGFVVVSMIAFLVAGQWIIRRVKTIRQEIET